MHLAEFVVKTYIAILEPQKLPTAVEQEKIIIYQIFRSTFSVKIFVPLCETGYSVYKYERFEEIIIIWHEVKVHTIHKF